MNAVTFYIIRQIEKEKTAENQFSFTNETYNADDIREEWYIGGNLHKSKVEEWKLATEENKMATCADFVMKMKSNISINETKKDASDLKNCIDEATSGSDYTNKEKVSKIAAKCVVLLGFN